MASCIAIITARGGSKRIPSKNVKIFCGKPIIEYSIKAAINSGIFNEVMVSTDDKVIAEIAIKFGADVPFLRSEKNADDFATTSDVLKEVLGEYLKIGSDFEYACVIYPTAPFVTEMKLKSAYEILKSKDVDSIVPIVQYSFPPQRGVFLEDGYVKMKEPQYKKTRSQDLEKIYHDCGQFYFIKINSFKEQGSLFMKRTIGLITSELEVQDIDNEVDWQLAELKYKLMMEKSR